MRKDSFFDQYEIFFNASCLAAHANFFEDGFRQRDVKFLIEMFSNWIDLTLEDQILQVHNTQVMRYLKWLAENGYARKISRKGQPRYRLTRSGLFYQLEQLVKRPPRFPIEHFYFVFHFVETYGSPIANLVRQEGTTFSVNEKHQLDQLLDVSKPLQDHIEYLEGELKKLKERVRDSQDVSKLVIEFEKNSRPTEELIKEIEKKYPYDLNSQKTLGDFYKEIPINIRDFILKIALKKRTEQMWIPLVSTMESHLKNLKALGKLA